MSKDVHIMIQGNNHRLIIDKDVVFNKGQIWFEDHDCEIYIGAGSTIEKHSSLLQKAAAKFLLRGLYVLARYPCCDYRLSSIIKLDSSERINLAKNVDR